MTSVATILAEASALDAGLAAILRDVPEVAAAWVFGSFARGAVSKDSDLDLALLLRRREKKPADVYMELATVAARAERLAGGRPVDVVLIEAQGPIFQHEVLAEGRLVYDADPERRVDFESDAHVRYFDYLPTHNLAAREAISGARAWFEGRR